MSNVVYYATRVALPPLFARMEVEGRENVPKGACIFIANHESVADAWKVVYAVSTWTPIYWVTGTFFYDWRSAGARCFPNASPSAQRCLGILASTLVRISPTIPYQRASDPPISGKTREEVNRETFKRAAHLLKEGFSIGIFPEGTRSSMTVTSSFIRMAMTAKVRVVPVKLPRRGELNVAHILPPLRYERMSRDEIDAEAMRVMGLLTGREVTITQL